MQVPHPLLAKSHAIDSSQPRVGFLEQAGVLVVKRQVPQPAPQSPDAELPSSDAIRPGIVSEALASDAWSPGAWRCAAACAPPPEAILDHARHASGHQARTAEEEVAAPSARRQAHDRQLCSHAPVEVLTFHEVPVHAGERTSDAVGAVLIVMPDLWAGVLLPQLVHAGAVPIGEAEARRMSASAQRLTFPLDFVECPAYWCASRRQSCVMHVGCAFAQRVTMGHCFATLSIRRGRS